MMSSPIDMDFSDAKKCSNYFALSFFLSQYTQRTLNEIEITLNETMVKEYASGVQNILCLKSYINGHRNGLLGSLAKTARSV